MALESMTARNFWHKLENRQKESEPAAEFFKRGTSYRNSYNSGAPQITLHNPVWGSIYCTMRDRSKGRGRSSSASASSQRGVIRAASSHRSTSETDSSTSPLTFGKKEPNKAKMTEILSTMERVEPGYIAPKRYETTCYFAPKAVPVWYSTTIALTINSTKRRYSESVNYQTKLVPYRYVETMTTLTPNTPKPIMHLSTLDIKREIPAEHFISLEPQQEAAEKAALEKSFSSEQIINIDSD